jgi:hypothetical protein
MTAAVSSVTVTKSTTRRHPAIAGSETQNDHDQKLERSISELTIHAKFYADNRRVAYYIATRAK